MSVEAAVREFLTQELGKKLDTVGSNDSLLESGAIDSIAVVKLVAFLEASYGVTVAEDDLVPDNFDTTAAIAAFVGRLQAGARG